MSVKRSFATHLIPQIAPQLRCSRNPPNIRNPLIYCVNRYFLIFGVSQAQKPYRASTNSFFDLLTLVSLYICIQNSTLILPTRNCLCGHDAGRACMLTLWIKNEHPVFCTECPILLLYSNYSLFNY